MKLFPLAAQQIIRTTLLALAAVSVPFLDSCQDSKQTPEAKAKREIKYSADPNAAKNMTLLLRDFDPKPMLHAAAHETSRAKCPVIDVHNHVNDPGGIHGEEIPVAEVVRRMDAANVRYPGQGRWEIYGMELPNGVLEKVYHKNADKIFGQFKGRP